MATTVQYKGQVLVTVDNQTKVLETSGTWMEDDLTLTDSSGSGTITVVDVPDAHGGIEKRITAVDISDTTATAEDVASGEVFYTANGTRTIGTASGGSNGMKLTTGTNLIDTSQFIADKYLENGAELTYNGWSITNYIPVTADKWYFIYSGNANEGFTASYSAYYDTNKNYIENFLPAGSAQPKYLTLSLAQQGMVNLMKSTHTGYLRLSQKTATVTGFGFYELDGDLDLSPIA